MGEREVKKHRPRVKGLGSRVNRGICFSLHPKKAFTLLELLIGITISIFIAAAIYWSVVTALSSWGYMKDELALQKVISQVLQELTEGTPDTYGLRDALEVIRANPDSVEVVYPWTDDTHMAQSGLYIYTLNRGVKPGTSIPIGEACPPDSNLYQSVPLSAVDWGKKDELNKVRLAINVAPGSRLRFTYHPDAKKNFDAITTYRWSQEDGQVYIEDSAGTRAISKNPFGVKITGFSFRCYNNANTQLSGGGSVDDDETQFIAGIEIGIEASLSSKGAKLGVTEKKKELLTFVSLRNSPARGGAVNLREGMKMPIPDSRHIKTLFLTNLTGIDDNDVLQIDADPESGNDWRLTITFGRRGLSSPIISSYTIEYPSGSVVFTDKPRTSMESGLNLLALSANGLYDYDKDEEIEDFVCLEGDVELKVTKMDISGAALFVR